MEFLNNLKRWTLDFAQLAHNSTKYKIHFSGYLGIKICLFMAAFLLINACGYKAGAGGSSPGVTFCVPLIEGDKDALFSSTIIREVSSRTSFQYNSENAQTILNIRILDLDDENVGFRYDRKRTGKLRHNVIPTETRIAVQVEMTLFKACDSTPILGPLLIEAAIDFDHEYYPNRDAINVFSLGQLTDYDAARDAAIFPLSRELARRIADRLIYCSSNICCE